MLGNDTAGCVGTNAAGGCVHLCGQRTAGAPAITHLAGVDGNGAACPAGSKPLVGAPGTAGGRYDFDPRGGGVTLCVTTTGAATAGRR